MSEQRKNLWLSHEMLLVVVLLAEWLFFSFMGRTFGTLDNNYDIARHSVEIGLLAVAMTAVILTGGIDLSVGSLLGLAAIVFGKLWRDAHWPVWLSILGTIGFGGMAGGLNALLITRLKLPPLIVTLGTFSLFRGLAEAITRGSDSFTNFPEAFLALGQDRWLGVPGQLLIFLGVAAVFWVLVHRTTLGRSFRAIGFSPEGSFYAGLPVKSRVSLVYVLSGITAALAGVIYTARLGQAKADAGTGYELLAITAVVLGGTSIFGGTGSIHGTILGVAAIAILNNGLFHMRQPREVAGMLTGVLLIMALTGSVMAKRLAARRQRGHSAASATHTE